MNMFRPTEHPANAMSRLLSLLGRDWRDSNVVRRLSPSSIVAESRHPERLRRCIEQLHCGKTAPTIQVTGYRLGSASLYVPSDGIHRTIAARLAGQKVRAQISGYYTVCPERFVVQDAFFWEKVGRDLRMVTKLNDEEYDVALKIGVHHL